MPIVSIVGRPNVGKSSLFNRILKRRIAVVDGYPGVTRDRNYMEVSWNGYDFRLVDTGGLIPGSKKNISSAIHKQVDIAIKESSAVIFLVEAYPGPTDLDLLIAKHLRKCCREKIILAVNKSESNEARIEAKRHAELGCGEPCIISAIHGYGIGDLLDLVCDTLKKSMGIKQPLNDNTVISIAIVGRPNVGKSCLVNKLLNNDRMIVDDLPGTTRDSIDTVMTYKKRKIKLIDTAGLRKKTQVNDNIEYYANLRALQSIERCDICALIIDAIKKSGEQDLKILNHINKLKRGTVVCWNKWDIVKKDLKTFDSLVSDVKRTYMEMQYIPMVSISALTGKRVTNVVDIAMQIKQRMVKRLELSDLRRNFFSWVKTHPHPFISNKEIKFFGVKQLNAEYPRFAFFCSNPNYILASYKRFLTNKFQETYNFSGCPIVFDFKTMGRRTIRKSSNKKAKITAKEF